MEHENNHQEYSIEVQDILGKPPHYLIRWGTGIISGILLLLIIGTFIFKYPVVISGPVVLFSQNPPIDVVSETSGRLDTIFFKNRKEVQRGDYVAVIRSTANTHDMFRLLQFTTGNPSILQPELLDSLPPETLEIGEIQDQYAEFRYNLLRYHRQRSKGYFLKKNELLKNRLQFLAQELQLTNKKLNINKKELAVSDERLYRDSILFAQKVLSQAQFGESRELYLRAQRDYKRLETEYSQLQARINTLETDNLDLDFREYEHHDNIESRLVQSHQTLKRSLAQWKKSYILQAPSAGVLNFNQFWYSNQFVKSGETVFSIIPTREGKIVGRVQVPPMNVGLIKKGQFVRIKLHNYPYLEFGSIQGEVNWISETPDNGRYLVEVHVPNFKTNYDKPIRFQQELMGVADITTKKRRFIIQLISPLRWIFSE